MELFDSLCSTEDARIISVALPRPLHQLFTYRLPAHLVSQVRVGGRVKVPFGRAVAHGFVVEPPRSLSEVPAGMTAAQLKEVLEVSDPQTALPEDVLSLCRWAHEFYCTPLGEIL